MEQSGMFQLRIYAACVGVLLLLLLPILHLRDSLGEAKKWIGCQLGELWIEVKALIFWGAARPSYVCRFSDRKLLVFVFTGNRADTLFLAVLLWLS